MSLLRASYDQLAIVDYSGRSAGIFWMLAELLLFASPNPPGAGLMGQSLGGIDWDTSGHSRGAQPPVSRLERARLTRDRHACIQMTPLSACVSPLLWTAVAAGSPQVVRWRVRRLSSMSGNPAAPRNATGGYRRAARAAEDRLSFLCACIRLVAPGVCVPVGGDVGALWPRRRPGRPKVGQVGGYGRAGAGRSCAGASVGPAWLATAVAQLGKRQTSGH